LAIELIQFIILLLIKGYIPVMMDINHQLSARQMDQLSELLAICQQQDGNVPNVYPHLLLQHRQYPVNLLFFQKDQLIGFLSIYFFYKNACEMALLVHPDHRRRGIGRRLIQTLISFLESQQIQRVIVTSPQGLLADWFASQGYDYDHSEYHMIRQNKVPVLIPVNPQFEIVQARMEHIPRLYELDALCFPDQHSNHLRFEGILADREYEVLVVLRNNELIGKAHIRWFDKKATLSDIGVFTEYRGKGIGTALIAHCINLILAESIFLIDLDVETKNIDALKLYSALGFLVENATDYWQISLPKLTELLKPA
jgi:ribosomal protein S18 acetylase RimI-like enzyme